MDTTEILHGARMTVEGLADRLAEILAAQADAAGKVSSEWTVRDAAAHLVGTTGLYAELVSGGASPIPELTPSAVAEYNAARLADIGETDSRLLSKALTVSVGQFLDATSGRPADTPINWHGGIRIDLAQLTGILVAEYVLHGYDIAAATGIAWPILPEHAALGLFGRGAVFPSVADPTTSRGHTAAYLLDLGVAGRLTVRFADGVLTVGTGDEPADCEIATDPVTMLMVSSGRLSPYMAIALGSYRAGGRRPHLAPGFTRLIYTF
ncbi:MAG TPA: maleylpyruvate isomerase N-terminal domain-containing protein [Nakamurella sp.]|jgi:uncharacterized protein (TIGR03083 family)